MLQYAHASRFTLRPAIFCLLAVTALAATARAQAQASATREWGIHRTLFGSGNSTDCAAPKSNCFDDVVIKGYTSALRRFDDAVLNNTTRDFFSGEEWKSVFPHLGNFPDQLDMLRGGLPLLRFKDDGGGAVRYLATRQSRDEIVKQMSGRRRKPISGVEFCLSVRIKR